MEEEGSRMPNDYVEQREGGYYIADSRVSLDSIIYAFLRGEPAEAIAESFPALTLERVYGALAFYLAQRSRIDAYIEAGKADFNRLRFRGPASPSGALCQDRGGARHSNTPAGMKPRFQADADLNRRIVVGLRRREPTIDFQDAYSGGVIGRPEPEVLTLAGRCSSR
jgi:uncharacterized protein (DUF433 family)